MFWLMNSMSEELGYAEMMVSIFWLYSMLWLVAIVCLCLLPFFTVWIIEVGIYGILAEYLSYGTSLYLVTNKAPLEIDGVHDITKFTCSSTVTNTYSTVSCTFNADARVWGLFGFLVEGRVFYFGGSIFLLEFQHKHPWPYFYMFQYAYRFLNVSGLFYWYVSYS